MFKRLIEGMRRGAQQAVDHSRATVRLGQAIHAGRIPLENGLDLYATMRTGKQDIKAELKAAEYLLSPDRQLRQLDDYERWQQQVQFRKLKKRDLRRIAQELRS